MEFAVYTWLYLSLASFITFVVIISLLALVASGLAYIYAYEWELEWITTALKAAKITAGIFLVSATVSSFLPSHDAVKLIVSAYVIGEGSKIEGVDKLPKNIVDALNHTLEQIKEKK